MWLNIIYLRYCLLGSTAWELKVTRVYAEQCTRVESCRRSTEDFDVCDVVEISDGMDCRLLPAPSIVTTNILSLLGGRIPQPWMLLDMMDGITLLWIDFEAAEHKIQSIATDWDFWLSQAALDGVRRIMEGRLSGKENGQKHSKRPDLRMRCSVRLALQDLRGGKIDGLTVRQFQHRPPQSIQSRCTYAEETIVVWRGLANIVNDGRAEVDQLYPEVLVDHDVLVFDVAYDFVVRICQVLDHVNAFIDRKDSR